MSPVNHFLLSFYPNNTGVWQTDRQTHYDGYYPRIASAARVKNWNGLKWATIKLTSVQSNILVTATLLNNCTFTAWARCWFCYSDDSCR